MSAYGEELLVIAVKEVGSSSEQFKVYRSQNAGRNWSVLNVDEIPFREHSEIFKIQKTLFISAIDLFSSDDDGQTWTSSSMPEDWVTLSHDQKNILVGNRDAVFLSQNKGASWIPLSVQKNRRGGILISDRLILVQHGQDMKISKDKGLTWQTRQLPETGADELYRGSSGRVYVLGNRAWSSDAAVDQWMREDALKGKGISSAVESGDEELILGSQHQLYKTTNSRAALIEIGDEIIGSRVNYMHTLPNHDLIALTNLGAFRTSNRGESWQEADIPHAVPFNIEAQFINAGDTTFFYNGDWLMRSTDNFESYELLNSQMGNVSESIYSLVYYKGVFYYVDRYNCKKSSDQGQTWTAIEVVPPDAPSFDGYLDVYIFKDVFFVLTRDGDTYRSADNAISWSRVVESNKALSRGVEFHSIDDRIFIVRQGRICDFCLALFSPCVVGKPR